MASSLQEAKDDFLANLVDFTLSYNAKMGDVREVLSSTLTEAWENTNDLIELNMEPITTTDIRSLVKSNGSRVSKVISVFAVLIQEIQSLKLQAESKFYGPLTMYAHRMEPLTAEDCDPNDSKFLKSSAKQRQLTPEEQMGFFLPVLQDLVNFVQRLKAVLNNYILQLNCLYSETNQLYLSTFKTVEFDYVFQSLGELLLIPITLDNIIGDNNLLQQHWITYKKMIQYVSGDPERFDITKDNHIVLMKQSIQLIENTVMGVRLFEKVLNYPFSISLTQPPQTNQLLDNSNLPQKPDQVILGNKVFANALTESISRLQAKSIASLDDFIQLHTFDRKIIIHSYALYALSRTLHGAILKFDKSLHRSLWEFQLQVPLIHLYARSSWYIPDFLHLYAKPPSGYDRDYFRPYLSQINDTRLNSLRDLQNDFFPRIQILSQQVGVWLVRLEGELSPNPQGVNKQQATQVLSPQLLLQAKSNLLLHGLLLGTQIKTTCLTTLHLFLQLNQPFPKRVLYGIFMSIELLKVIQLAYQRRMLMISEHFHHIILNLGQQLTSILGPIKEKLDRRDPLPSKLNNTKQDIHTSLTMFLDVVQNGCISTPTISNPNNPNVAILLQLGLPIAQIRMLLKSNVEGQVDFILWKLITLHRFNSIIFEICNCSFIYWIANALGFILNDIFISQQASQHAARITYISLATRDCSNMLSQTTSIPVGFPPNFSKNLVSLYQAEVRGYIRSQLILPIVRYIETDLRLHIHSVVLEQTQLVSKHSHLATGTKNGLDVKNFMLLSPFRLFDTLYCIKDQVERALDHSFYNHNTITLHDSKIYNDIKNLAINKFGLDLLPITMLPTSSHFSESLDVLEIMRNIHIFVSRYNYNLHQQFFIEKSIDQKHLNIINIGHIATSIQTHGMGIMNTTVNFTYQFLVRKIVLIHEFLFDENIKSPLHREMRQWRLTGRKENNNQYPYNNALKLYKDIKRLGINQQGHSYIDQLRTQITEIGNALGYVRLVRSGGLHVLAQNIQVLPSMDNDNSRINFKNVITTSALSPITIQAAGTLDDMINTVFDNVSEGTNYFSILIMIFRDTINIQENPHLNTFFILVPILTLNYVENILAKKEKLGSKNSKLESAFCDDGFALGIAYLLTLLQQDYNFDSIHWFESVLLFLDQNRSTLQNEIQKAQKNKDKNYDFEHSNLTLTRQNTVIQEYELIYSTINAARVFFRSTVELQEGNNANNNNNNNNSNNGDKKEDEVKELE
jgi:WASH complex subunit 7